MYSAEKVPKDLCSTFCNVNHLLGGPNRMNHWKVCTQLLDTFNIKFTGAQFCVREARPVSAYSEAEQLQRPRSSRGAHCCCLPSTHLPCCPHACCEPSHHPQLQSHALPSTVREGYVGKRVRKDGWVVSGGKCSGKMQWNTLLWMSILWGFFHHAG